MNTDLQQHPFPVSKVRIDKWLWAARFYKTRSLAKQAIDGGKIRYNGARCKTSKEVEVGALIELRQGYDDVEIRVEQLSDQRRFTAKPRPASNAGSAMQPYAATIPAFCHLNLAPIRSSAGIYTVSSVKTAEHRLRPAQPL